MRFALTPVLVVLCFAARALAWGGEGHQVVALIAEERLTPEAQAGIHQLLGDDVNISDAEIANWADQIRRDRKETGGWHFVNIPIGTHGYDAERDGNHGDNIIDKLAYFETVVADKTKSQDERAEALKFVVHFAGDIEQPLHCADRNKDRGGNAVPVLFLDDKDPTNLHAVWDTRLLRQYINKQPILDYAKRLNAHIAPDSAKHWALGTTTDWANESFRVAGSRVYAGIPVDDQAFPITPAYVKAKQPVVELQLERGGVRLAMLLNHAFAK